MGRTGDGILSRLRELGIVALVASGSAVLGSSAALAQSQPIRSPQDAACRDEARDRVFTAPDPRGLGPYAIGSQLYAACMKRQARSGRSASGKGRRANRR